MLMIVLRSFHPFWYEMKLWTFLLFLIFFYFQFGHALQHLLTRVPYSEASGLTNIEWDAVEVCSNFMQNW